MRVKRTTLMQLSAEAGVAINTARKALSGDPTIRPHLRCRVLAAADRLKYRPNLLARALRRQQLDMVPLTLPLLSNPYFGRLATSLCHALAGIGKEPAFCIDPEHLVELGTAFAVCGCIIGYAVDRRLLQRIARRQRVVTVNSFVKPPAGCGNVAIDFAPAYRDATQRLLRTGRRRVAICSDFVPMCLAKGWPVQKFNTVLDVLNEAALQPVRPADGVTFTTPEAVTEHLRAGGAPPDVVFCENDPGAARLFGLLVAMGIRVPGDILVVGCDDTLRLSGTWSIRVDFDELAAHATELLQQLLDGGTGALERVHVPQLLVPGAEAGDTGQMENRSW